MYPIIHHVEPMEFGEEIIRKIYNEEGELIGFIERTEMTREELKKLYPDSDTKETK